MQQQQVFGKAKQRNGRRVGGGNKECQSSSPPCARPRRSTHRKAKCAKASQSRPSAAVRAANVRGGVPAWSARRAARPCVSGKACATACTQPGQKPIGTWTPQIAIIVRYSALEATLRKPLRSRVSAATNSPKQ